MQQKVLQANSEELEQHKVFQANFEEIGQHKVHLEQGLAQNKVQYQRGLSMPEFFEACGSVEQCKALVRGWRWREGFRCLRRQGSWHREFRRQDRLCFQCSGCRSYQVQPGQAPDDADQEQRVDPGAQAPPGRVVP